MICRQVMIHHLNLKFDLCSTSAVSRHTPLKHNSKTDPLSCGADSYNTKMFAKNRNIATGQWQQKNTSQTQGRAQTS